MTVLSLLCGGPDNLHEIKCQCKICDPSCSISIKFAGEKPRSDVCSFCINGTHVENLKVHRELCISENKFVLRSDFGETVTYEPPHDKDCLPPSHSLILLLQQLVRFRMARFPSEESAILSVKLREAQEWLKVK